ncbi:hypothetical protein PMAYCL1PPCAC_20794, partial [Pristionchus mayeri]
MSADDQFYRPKEPKQEPLDDFLSTPPENEISDGPFLALKEPKEEPLFFSLFRPYSLENEIEIKEEPVDVPLSECDQQFDLNFSFDGVEYKDGAILNGDYLSSENADVKKGKRPSKNFSRATKHVDYRGESDGEEPTVKKMRSNSLESNDKTIRTMTTNELECPECEYRCRSAICGANISKISTL